MMLIMNDKFNIPRKTEMTIRYYLYIGLVSEAQILVRKYATEAVTAATVIEKTNSYKECQFVQLWERDTLIKEIPFAFIGDMNTLASEIMFNNRVTKFTIVSKEIR